MFYQHETAVIDPGAQIGPGSRIWHFVHVCGGARIGRDCSLGQNVFVGNKRSPFYLDADLALAKCLYEGGRLWLYAGSVQTLEYVTRQELKHSQRPDSPSPSAKQLSRQARDLLEVFTADQQWLAALAAEGAAFDGDDPEDEQLLRALARLGPDARLLSRDGPLAERYPERVLSPAAY